MKSKEELSLRIDELRAKMVQTGNKNGMNHPLTIQISQKLDKLITEYMKLIHKK